MIQIVVITGFFSLQCSPSEPSPDMTSPSRTTALSSNLQPGDCELTHSEQKPKKKKKKKVKVCEEAADLDISLDVGGSAGESSPPAKKSKKKPKEQKEPKTPKTPKIPKAPKIPKTPKEPKEKKPKTTTPKAKSVKKSR